MDDCNGWERHVMRHSPSNPEGIPNSGKGKKGKNCKAGTRGKAGIGGKVGAGMGSKVGVKGKGKGSRK